MKYLNPVKLQPVAALPTSPPSIITQQQVLSPLMTSIETTNPFENGLFRQSNVPLDAIPEFVPPKEIGYEF